MLNVVRSGMSGLDLQRQLLAAGVQVPVVVITALHDGHTRHAAEALGCVAYLEKPCEGYKVLAVLRSLSKSTGTNSNDDRPER